jgi:hypothetical protein
LKSSSFRGLYQLLRDEVRPRLPALLCVFGLASLTAFSQKAPILLIEPLLQRVLFPPTAEEAANPISIAAFVTSRIPAAMTKSEARSNSLR